MDFLRRKNKAGGIKPCSYCEKKKAEQKERGGYQPWICHECGHGVELPMPKVKAPKVEPKSIDIAELKEVCYLTVKLTELRQRECKHLAIENFAPECFAKLLTQLTLHKDGKLIITNDTDVDLAT